jgi:hypothetical protein
MFLLSCFVFSSMVLFFFLPWSCLFISYWFLSSEKKSLKASWNFNMEYLFILTRNSWKIYIG